MRKFFAFLFSSFFVEIDEKLFAQVTVNPGGTNYTTLKAAFDAVNAGTHTGTVLITLSGNTTETASAVLNGSGTGSASYTSLSISPTGGAVRTVSGSVTTGALIDLSGADNIIIDGLNIGGNGLVLRNTSASTGAVIRLINDATGNTITNCTLEGQNSATTSGLLLFSTAVGLTLGNSNNFITNNVLRDRTDAGAPFTAQVNCIYSSGTSTAANAGNTIMGNSFRNFATNGINLTATGIGNSWTISNNHFFNDRATPPSATQTSILISGGSSHVISGNFIGGQTTNAGGAVWLNTGNSNFTAINLAGVGAAGAVSVQGNTIKNIQLNITSSAIFNGIVISGASTVNAGTVTANTIGDPNVVNSIQNAGSNSSSGINSSSSGNVNFSNNMIANITSTNTSTNVAVRGITHTGSGNFTAINNTIKNISAASAQTSSTSPSLAAINSSSTSSGQVIRANKINGLILTNTGNVTNYVQAIIVASGSATPGTIAENVIFDIQNMATLVASNIIGIHVNTGSWDVVNNLVAISNSPNTNNTLITGVLDAPGAGFTVNVYHNTVSIGGSAPTGASGSYGYLRQEGGTSDVKNNIFTNSRTGSAANHYAIGDRSPVVGVGLTSNYNDLYSANPASLGDWNNASQTFAQWQTISGGDANSLNVLPVFISPTDLHMNMTANMGLDNKAPRLATVLTDIDANSRGTMTDMGGDEFTTVLPVTFNSLRAYQKNNLVELEWQTSAEYNLDSYKIERCADGYNYQTMGSVSVSGNSNTIKNYRWTDLNPVPGNNYYRVRIVDKNGKEELSPVVRIYLGKVLSGISISPNPLTGNLLNLSINNIEAGNYTIEIFDANGRKLMHDWIQHNGGSASIYFKMQNLSSGTYLLRMTGKDVRMTRQFVK